LFWIYNVSNLIYGLGYFFPSLFLPSYATTLGLAGWQGALLLTVMSISQVLGQFTFGYLSDGKVKLNYLIAIATVVPSIAAFACWGIARSFGPLLVFAILFGFFAAGYTAMWARMVTAVTEEQSSSLVAFSVFCFGKGVGNILAGPISGQLILPLVRIPSYGVVKFSTLIIFTGVAMALSAICVCVWYGAKSMASVRLRILRVLRER
jgi:MFS family permease